MAWNIEEQIHGIRLTKTERIIADYFLEHQESLCFMTAKDISLSLNISDTSVIRFCRTLGYRGFRELQEQIRGILSQSLEQERYVVPRIQIPEKYNRNKDLSDDVYQEMVFQNIRKAITRNNAQSYALAIDVLLQSDHIFIAGFRGLAAAALHLGISLSQYLQNVRYYSYADSSCIESMLDCTAQDCVILLGAERYSRMSLVLAVMARDQHCKFIAVTDKGASPLARDADVVFVADIEGPSAMNCYMGVFFVIETLSFELSRHLGVAPQKRLERLDRYIPQIGLY